MFSLLLVIIYLAFISLGLPDSLLGSAWVGFTALALFGFSVSTKFWMLCLMSVPYGLGAGAVDAALNNYVALHYSSRHMSWLHAFWGGLPALAG